MRLNTLVLVTALVIAVSAPAAAQAQNTPDFSGTWKLEKVDPPLPAPRPGAGGGGAAGVAGPANTFSPAPEMVVISQAGNQITLQIGSSKGVYAVSDTAAKLVAASADVNALKTRAHWDGPKLHLHFKQGMNFGRDILSLSGGTLTITRDLESGGGSTTRTLTYSKTS